MIKFSTFIKEKINLSDNLKDLLASINSNISNKVLSLDGLESDIENVDIDVNPDFVKFSTINNKGRFTPVRTGKFIRKILDDTNTEYIQADIEKFVNSYRAELDTESNIRILKGKDILFGYIKNNYSTGFDRGCSLYSSCMTDSTNYLELYTQNSNCSLAILENNGKIDARAMLWNATVDGKENITFMDRIYSINNVAEEKLRKWALKNNYLVVINGRGDGNTFKDRNDNKYQQAIVKLEHIELAKYPYVDTVRYKYDNYLTNTPKLIPMNKKSFILDSTSGDEYIYGVDINSINITIISGNEIAKYFNKDITLPNGIKVYKYDSAFNVDSFADDEKTKWLVWVLVSTIPPNFLSEHSWSNFNGKSIKWKVISNREIEIMIKHYKRRDRRFISKKKESQPLNIRWVIRIKPTNILSSFYLIDGVKDKKPLSKEDNEEIFWIEAK